VAKETADHLYISPAARRVQAGGYLDF
jgi:hypothetical protein